MKVPAEPKPGLRVWQLTAVGLLAFVCYANTFGLQFTYDDIPIIAQNDNLRPLPVWNELLFRDYWGASGEVDPNRDRLYRPLTMYSYGVQQLLLGGAPFYYHLGNVLLHVVASLLVVWLGVCLLGSAAPAVVAGALFAVHPVHVEAVANIVGRAEILTSIFLALGLITLLRPRQLGVQHWLLAGVCGTLGLLAKETAICYPLLFGLVAYFGRTTRPALWPGALLLLAPLLVYFPLRIDALGGQLLRTSAVDPLFNPLVGAEVTPAQRVIGALTILGHYTRLMLWPASLQSDYGLRTIDPARGVELMTLLGALSAALLAYGASRLSRGRFGLLCAGLLISYLLVSNTVLLIGVTVGERLAYWPSVLVCLLLAIGWQRLPRQTGIAVLVVLLVLGATRSLLRNPAWYDNMTLFARDAAQHPDNIQLQLGYADTLLRSSAATVDGPDDRLAKQAIALLDRALQLTARTPQLLTKRGYAAWLAGDANEAEQFLRQALQLNPSDRDAQRYLAEVRNGGAFDPTVLDAPRDGRDADALLEQARMLQQAARHEEARRVFEQVLLLRPEDARATRDLGDSLIALGLHDDALPLYERAAALDDDDWQSHLNISALVAHVDRDKAWKHATRAADLQPNDWRVQYNLAEGHILFGRNDDAVIILQRIADGFASNDPRKATIEERIRAIK